MEHTNKNINKAQQVSSDSLGASGGTNSQDFEKLMDGLIKSVNSEGFNLKNKKELILLGGDTLKSAYKDAHENSGNFNNTARTIAMGATALIPYGGAFISPLLGLLWPENVPNSENLIEKMKNELVKMMDEKIQDFDLDILRTDTKHLKKQLVEFENIINGKKTESFYTGSIEETRRADVLQMNSDFDKLLNRSRKENRLIAELPIFTIVAVAYLEFLHFMEKNAKSTLLKFDSTTINEKFITPLPIRRTEYLNHVKKTYEEGNKEFEKKMKIIAIKVLGKNNPKPQDNLDRMTDVIADLRKQKKAFEHSISLRDFDKEIKEATDFMNEYAGLLHQKNQFYNNTWGNEAFRLMVKVGGWVKENGKWYCFDENGNMLTELNQFGDKWYYFSPEKTNQFEKGEMVTGWLDYKGYRYYFSPEKTNQYEEGQMVTGFVHIKSATYVFDLKGHMVTGWYNKQYFSPEKTNKFEKGQMVTGWLSFSADSAMSMILVIGLRNHISPDAIIKKNEELKKQPAGTKIWVYFSPGGQSISNTKQTIDGKMYEFDKFGICLNP
ncbi:MULTISPECIES: insecticidal delta-endotoxin Cry8Ea1 family protein [Bacillus cereus group]|uniref:insecticidal delta-endotoxin Cry8Ea1 family protein n=1 Tax=Bacillus cereus group TaxID=86661 RepID=UPI000BF3FA14|nr:insecticidal delta-endotoxin Cry8Ea1 family protein [Bacillus cereus]PFA42201.1 hypothetical protein CN381_22155 [Bacillus cereus]HDR4457513.1 hypothetical protein [Bacillus cereus]HDR8028849.1 hypothetical protein [Bacillus cereus]HDR8428338.1 hypothetical protein [Bacillus cereus]HDR8446474.1 hypothetical protein [Bacillus cereus]